MLIFAGGHASAAVTEDGHLYSWGQLERIVHPAADAAAAAAAAAVPTDMRKVETHVRPNSLMHDQG